MGIPHKHAELIKAWADGAEIQVRDLTNYSDPKDCTWKDFSEFDDVVWYSGWEYRIKPKTIKYRLYLYKGWASHKIRVEMQEAIHESDKSNCEGFIKWLGDWQEVEV